MPMHSTDFFVIHSTRLLRASSQRDSLLFRKELSCELTFDTLSRIIEWRSERPDGWQVPDYIEEKVENTSERPLSG